MTKDSMKGSNTKDNKSINMISDDITETSQIDNNK